MKSQHLGFERGALEPIAQCIEVIGKLFKDFSAVFIQEQAFKASVN